MKKFLFLIIMVSISLSSLKAQVEVSFETRAEGKRVQFFSTIINNAEGTNWYVYEWTFGDGSTSTEEDPVHTYNDYGTYYVTLVVTIHNFQNLWHFTTTWNEAKYVTISQDINNPNGGSSEPTVYFETSINDHTVLFTPIIIGNNVVDYTCNWTFGDNQSATGNFAGHPYTGDGPFTATLTVSYTTTDNPVYRPKSYSNTISFNDAFTTPPASGPYGIKLERYEQVFDDSWRAYYYSDNELPSNLYSFLYINGVKDRQIGLPLTSSSSSSAPLANPATPGLYTIQVCITDMSLNIIEWSNSLTCFVKEVNSQLDCPPSKCLKAEFYYPSVSIKPGDNATFDLYVTELNSANTCSSFNGANWEQHWKKTIDGSTSSIDPVLSTLPNLMIGHQAIEMNTSALGVGEYSISNVIMPQSGTCDGSFEAITILKVKPKLEIDPDNKIESLSSTTDSKYNLDLDYAGDNKLIEIEGPTNCDGAILVNGDWISVDRFNKTELSISCTASGTEHRKGRIIISFPDTYEPVTIEINQSPSIWEVKDDKELAFAVQNAEDGTTIVMDEGTYHTPIRIRGKNITLASKFHTTSDPYYIDNTFIDAQGKGRPVSIDGNGKMTGTTRLIGFHITGGNASLGGGIYCRNTQLELSHLLIHGNYGATGGGVYCDNSKINAVHITMAKNKAEQTNDALMHHRGNDFYIRNNSEINMLHGILGGDLSDNSNGDLYFDKESPKSIFRLDRCFRDVWSVVNVGPSVYSEHSTVSFAPAQEASMIIYEDYENDNFWIREKSSCFRAGRDGKDLGALTQPGNFVNGRVVSASPKSITFDDIILGGEPQTKEVEITNTYGTTTWDINTPEDLIVTAVPGIGLGSEDFYVVPNKVVLKKGETKKIYVTFNPQSYGTKIGSLDIRTRSSKYVEKVELNARCVTKPDLISTVIDQDLELKSGRYIWGLGYRIQNTGGTPTTASKVKYYLSPVSFVNELAVPLGEQEIGILQPNEILSPIEFNTLNIPQVTQTGNYFFIAVVDAENAIDEHNETNNVLVKQISVVYSEPALTVTDAKYLDPRYEFVELGSAGVQPGDNLKVYFKVSNALNEQLVYNVKIYLSDNYTYDASDTEIAFLSGLVISPNSTTGGGYATVIIPEDAESGGKFMLIRAFEEWLPEANEQISTYYKNLEILRKPDYELFWAQQPLRSFFPGEGFFSSVAIRNTSNSSSPATKIKYYLSTNPNYDTTDIELATVNVDEIIWNEATSRTINQTLIIPGGTAPGTWHIIYYADPDNQVDEESETNNFFSSEIQIESHPDLLMLPLTLSANNIMAGTSVSVSGAVTNIDYGEAPESKLRIYLSFLSAEEIPNKTNDIFLKEIIVPPLAKDETYAFENEDITIPFESGGGNYYIYAKADGELHCPYTWCDIKETNEDNNIAMAPINVWRQPDLHFGNMRPTYNNATISTVLEGSAINLAYEIWNSNGNMNTISNNTGLSYAGENTLNCYLSNSPTLETGTHTLMSSIILESFYGGTRLDGNITLNIPEDLVGEQWYIITTIDSENSVDERDETNNEWVQGLLVAKKPDLVLLSQTITSQLIEHLKTEVKYSFVIDNGVKGSMINYFSGATYISNDEILGADDKIVPINIGEGSLDERLPFEFFATFNLESVIPNMSAGQYYLITKVTTNVAEKDISNNSIVTPLVVAPTSDLDISYLSLSHTMIQEGTDFTVSCTITNNHAKTSEPCILNFRTDLNDHDKTYYDLELDDITIPALVQGEEIIINRTYNIPVGTRAYSFIAFCDEANINSEFSRTNNKYSIPIDISVYNPPLNVLVSALDPTTIGGSNGSAYSTVSGGVAPYNYIWYKEGVTYSTGNPGLENMPEGNYRLYVTDNYGGSGENIFRLTAPKTFQSVEGTVTNVSIHSGNDGLISIRNIGGVSPFTYNWYKNGLAYSNGKDISGLTAGTYILAVTDNTGTFINKEFMVTEPDPILAAEYTVTNVSTKGANDGGIDLNIVSGTPPYNISWTKKDFSYASSSEDLSELSPGTYSVNITDALGKKLSYEMNIQTLELLLKVTNISSNGLSNGSIQITPFGGVPPYSYEWTKDGIYFSNLQSIDNLETGEYSITATDPFGLTTSETVLISDPDVWILEHSTTDVSSYNGNDGAIDITVSGGNPPFTYAWSNGRTTEDINGITAGIYEVTISDNLGLERTESFEVHNPLFVSGTKTDNMNTEGMSGSINVSCMGGYPPLELTVYKSGIPYAILGSLADGQQTDLSNLSSGEYSVIYTDTQDKVVSASYHITDPVIINLTATGLTAPASNDGQLSAKITGGLPPYTYQWQKDSEFYSNEINLSSLSQGEYNLTVTDVEGRSKIASATLTDYLPTVEISGGGTICNNVSETSIILQMTGRSPWNVLLSNGSENINLNNITTNDYEYSTNIPGTYHVISGGDNLYSFGSISGSATIAVAELPTATITGGGSLCQNSGTVPISVDFTGEAPWEITYTNGTLIFKETDITESHYEFNTSIPGSYTITGVKDGNCTGTSSGTAEVTVKEVPVAYVSGKGSCENNGTTLVNIELTGAAPWNLTYTDGISSFDVNDITNPNFEIIASVAGTYSITQLSDASGCPGLAASSVEISLDPLPLPTATLSGGGAICQNETANLAFDLTGSAPWNITYTDGTTNSEIISWVNNFMLSKSTPGTWQVTSLSDANCVGTNLGVSAEIIVNPLPVINLGDDASFCEGSILTLDAGAGYQTYIWNGVTGSRQLEVNVPDAYAVEVTDNNGCTGSDNIVVTMNQSPVVDLGPDITAPADAFIYFTAEPGYQSYEWPGNNTCRVLCVSMQNVNTYSDVWLNVTDENGCVGSDVVRLSLESIPPVSAVPNISESTTIQSVEIRNQDIQSEEFVNPVVYKLYPNPTNGKLSLLISEPARVKFVNVYDLKGNLIKTFNDIQNSRIELDLTNYAKGVYIIKVKEDGSTVKEFKIIRN